MRQEQAPKHENGLELKRYRKGTRTMDANEQRSLSTIAREIMKDWKKPYFAAIPYLDVMRDLDKITDMYMADSARSIVTYFLSNAGAWRGPEAKRIKAELNAMLKGKK